MTALGTTSQRRQPRICCLDLDMFFVSVERLLQPALQGQPVIVGAGPGKRGVVLSASYEVRPLGVHSGMSMTQARKLAPQAHFIAPSGDYSGYAQKVRNILERYTPQVQTASIDEFLLDFHGCESLYRRPEDPSDDAMLVRVLHEVRAQILDELGLPASAGIGCTKIVAKMASGLAKPLQKSPAPHLHTFGSGVVLVPAGAESTWLGGLPLRRFPGIGKTQESKLSQFGLSTLAELLALTPDKRLSSVAEVQQRVYQAFFGETASLGRDRPAFREHDPTGLAVGALSNESTFGTDIADPVDADARLLALVERVCWRARSRGVRARTVSLKVRFNNFDTVQRSCTGPPSSDDPVVLATARALLDKAWAKPRRLRLLGVALSNLVPEEAQLALPFGPSASPSAPPLNPAPSRSSAALDTVRDRFGFGAIRLGTAAVKRGQ